MKKLISLFSALLLVSLASCGGSENDEPDVTVTKPPVVGEITVTDQAATSFTVTADVNTNGNAITASGFCYVSYAINGQGTTTPPVITDYKFKATVVDGKMSADFKGLLENFVYLVRGYVSYGDNKVEYSPMKTVILGELAESATPAEVLAYVGPEYADDYRNFSGWDQRANWNLANVHDPTVMLADDGYYYMYQTDASFGNTYPANTHFHARRSRDLVNWEYLGATMTGSPKWITDKVNEYRAKLGLPDVDVTKNAQGFWAPVARNIGGGKYRMYYSVVNDGTLIEPGAWNERSFIGLMETTDPASNKWEDKGFVICAASDRGTSWKRNGDNDWKAYNRWNAIDPTFIITPEGEHWLIYGSWHSGFAAVQLDPATGKTLNPLPDPWGTASDIAPYGKLVNTRKMGERWQGSEGPEVVYRDGWYYMFMAYDGLDVPYNTRVVRSRNVDGPYVDMYGTNVSEKGGDAFPIVTHPYKFGTDHGWVGISHCAVWSDGNDNWFYASQARYPMNYDSWAPNAIMLGHVRAIRWTKDGWPLVMPERYGAVPQIPISEAEIAGVWDHIDLTYKYGEQRGSQPMEFGEDHKITSGPWKGSTWKFDATSQTISLSNGVELYLMRECNWEGNRRATIVYAALGDHKTYWGKKQ